MNAPLPMLAIPRFFPTHELPPLIRDAALEVQAKIKAPIELVVASALSAVSLACQQRIRIRRFNGLESPANLFFLSVAESGERKTTADSIFVAPIREFDDRNLQISEKDRDAFEAKKKIWRTKEKSLLNAIRKAFETGENEDELQQKLQQHQQERPKPPKVPRLLFQDVTPEAMLQAMQNWPSASLWSSEAGGILNGRGFSNITIFNELWDGRTLTVDRKSAESIRIENAKLTISLMTQPKTFQKFLSEKGELARDNGFLARCLITWPYSTQGFRPETDLPVSDTGLTNFHQRITEILTHHETTSPTGIEILEFSAEAKRTCRDFTNNVESRLSPYGDCKEIRDFASKIADNMTRLAGLFHFFEGNTGEIQPDTVIHAIRVSEYFLEEFKRIFTRPPEIPEEQTLAFEVENWLFEKVWLRNQTSIKRNYVRNHGPNAVRDRNKLNAALAYLENQNKVSLAEDDKRTMWILLNHDAFAYRYPTRRTRW